MSTETFHCFISARLHCLRPCYCVTHALETRWLGVRKSSGIGLFNRNYRLLSEETRWLGFWLVSVCLETRWLSQRSCPLFAGMTLYVLRLSAGISVRRAAAAAGIQRCLFIEFFSERNTAAAYSHPLLFPLVPPSIAKNKHLLLRPNPTPTLPTTSSSALP